MPRLEADRLCLEPRHLALLQGLLRRHVPGAEVWAYGSRVSGGAHETSDLDLVLRDPADSGRTVEGKQELEAFLREFPAAFLALHLHRMGAERIVRLIVSAFSVQMQFKLAE